MRPLEIRWRVPRDQAPRRVLKGGGLQSRPASGPRSRILASAWTYRLAVLAIVGIAWEAFARLAHSLLIPTFLDVVGGTVTLVQDPSTWQAFFVSNQALVLGFGVCLALGIPLGLAIARFQRIEGYLDPYLNILITTPTAVLIPIFMMSIGIGLESRVVVVVVFAIPVLIVNTRAGVRGVDPRLIEMATSFGASERKLWWRILLPGALPAVMSGVRAGLGRAVAGMVIIELLLVAVGIGNLILQYRSLFEPGLLYGVVILVLLEALILMSVVRAVEHRLAPWASQTVLRD